MQNRKKRTAAPFSEEELKIIRETPLQCIKDLAFKLGRDYDAVRKKKWVMEHPEKAAKTKERYHNRGCAQNKTISKCAWTKAEKDLVMTSDKTDAELSVELRRSINSIHSMRARLKKEQGRKNK